jgi:hypothetical protein
MDNMTVREKINAGHYENKLPYPDRVSKLKHDPATYQVLYTAYKTAKDAYDRESRRLMDEFKNDAISEVGLSGHTKAGRVYDFAWDQGHGSGLWSVMDWLEQIADLLLDD